MKLYILLIATLLLFGVHTQSNIIANKDIAITIYNNNLGVVKDTRTIQFVGGVSELNFTDVAATILPETVTFNALNTSNRVGILEQNY